MKLLNKTFALAITALALHAHAAPYQAIVPAKSSVTFSYKQMGVGIDGRFKKFAAQVNFDPAKAEAGKASFDVELASVDAGSSEADDEVVTKSWFNAAAFPKASFVAKQFKQTAPNQYEVTGSLSIKGQTRDVKFPLRHVAQGTQGLLSGEFTIRRGDFAIGEGMWSKFDTIANEVQIRFQLTAQAGQ